MFQRASFKKYVNASDGDRSSVVNVWKIVKAWKNVLMSKGHTMMGVMAGNPLYHKFVQ